MTNGFEVYENEEYLEPNSDPVVKEEPMSEEEATTDLPRDCILCTKQFHTLSGLKAHVITHHNYKTVKRKVDGSISPEKNGSSTGKSVLKYTCNICKRNFTTSTDLKVHEVCHNKFTCFACDSKFESFNAVTQHRRWCKVKDEVIKPKTLTDILKERVAQKHACSIDTVPDHWECLECMLSFRNIFYYKLHLTKNHPDSQDSHVNKKNNAEDMIEIEINIKQEVKDEKTIKEEKAEADYKKIETELESMFDNPSESNNISKESINRSEQLEEINFRKSDQDTIENILCSVTAKEDNQMDTDEACKQNNEDQNKIVTTFKHTKSNNNQETGKVVDSNMETNNEDVLKELTHENDSQNNKEAVHASETTHIEDNNMEIDAPDKNNQDKNTKLDNPDKCELAIANSDDSNNQDKNTELDNTDKCELAIENCDESNNQDKNTKLDSPDKCKKAIEHCDDSNNQDKNTELDNPDKCELAIENCDERNNQDKNTELDNPDKCELAIENCDESINQDKNTELDSPDKCELAIENCDDSNNQDKNTELDNPDKCELVIENCDDDNNQDKNTELDNPDNCKLAIENKDNEKTEYW